METLPSSGGGKSGLIEKLIRYLPIIAIGVGLFYFWGVIVPFVEETLKNTLLTVVYGIILAGTIGPIILYPKVFWMGYKSFCKKLTSLLIKMDPLSYMDRYVDTLSEKLDNLNGIKVQLQGRQVAAERRIKALQQEVQDHLHRGQAALKQNNQSIASLEGTRLEGAKKSIALYTPNYERMTKSLTFLNALSENWGMSIIQLREEIARKREEFEVLRDEAKALHQAEEFLSGNTPEGQIYQESLKALEYTVTQKIAYIEDFEKRSKNIMDGITVDNQATHDEGLAALEAYMKDDKLLMPNSYAVPKFNTAVAQEVQYEEVKEKKSFNLLD